MQRSIVLLGALLWSCTDVPLGIPDEEIDNPTVDDELTITGQYCTSPAADIIYPVKVMFIVDGSGSQQFTDQNRQRVVAVEETINALIGSGSTSFSVIVFNASVTATPVPDMGSDCETYKSNQVFTSQPNDLSEALNNLAEADTLTDYQGALGVAYQYLKRDMECTYLDRPAELGRTKYVVIVVSDGCPDPQCTVGVGNDFDPVNPTQPYPVCEDSDFINCLLKVDCGQPGGTDCSAGNICDYNGTTCFAQGGPGCTTPNLFGQLGSGAGLLSSELAGGSDYNQPYQILQKVESIMELQDRFQVAELRLHAGLVFDPGADPTVVDIFCDAPQAAPLIQQMADIGNGRYMEFYGGDSIDFLDINFQSIKQQRVIRAFFADNRAARVTANGLEPDTDFDGLTDDEETLYGTKPNEADSDNDGYRDLVEVRQLGFSYDPNDFCFPPIDYDPATNTYSQRLTPCDKDNAADIASFWNYGAAGAIIPCAREGAGEDCASEICDEKGFLDRDSDGLRDCEEHALGTNPEVPDSDADGMTDQLEVWYGLDPLRWDTDRDDDKDTIPNGQEIEWHLNPIVQQAEEDRRDRYRYDRPEVGRTIDGRSCYEFEVRKMRLAFTRDSNDLPTPVTCTQNGACARWQTCDTEIGLCVPNYDGVGFNEIRLYLMENMADNLSGTPLVRSACVRAQYVPPSKKVPASGEVELSEEDFKYMWTTDEADSFSDQALCTSSNDCPAGGVCVSGFCADVSFRPEYHCILAQ
jgi:hypothetical protein